jgi:UDP-N-acetylglucosamine 2-epimerase (non-hydrolysing)
MKVMSIVGARPNFMKVAPIITAIRARNARIAPPCDPAAWNGESEAMNHVLVHTGQHYDQAMSDSFFADLCLPEPDYNLGVGSGSLAAQTAEIMRKFEAVLLREQPDVLIVVGDVNSTLACALVAAKISFDGSGRRPLIAHVEAGLRSFDRTMPEEVNRVLTDQLSDLLFTTEESAQDNLMREGVPADRVHFVGNTMIDSLLAYRDKADTSTILGDLGLRNSIGNNSPTAFVMPYVLLTLHRPANVDHFDTFLSVLTALEDLAKEYVIVFPAHPRTRKRIAEFGLEARFSWNNEPHGPWEPELRNKFGTIRLIEPLGYLDFLCLMSNATLVVTDSGGIQEETTCLGVRCVTVRDNTERPVTVTMGTNVLAGLRSEGIRAAVKQQLVTKCSGVVPPYWDGQGARRIIEVLDRVVRKERSLAEEETCPTNQFSALCGVSRVRVPEATHNATTELAVRTDPAIQ